MPRVLVSVPWASPWADGLPLVHQAQTRLVVRSVDWQLRKGQRLRHVTADAWRTFWCAASCDSVVVCTTALDAVVLALLMRFRPRQCLAVYDLLLPRSRRGRLLARWALRRVDAWLVIRRGDALAFQRELGARHCTFVPFPAQDLPAAGRVTAPMVYAAGTAHRDWSTLVAAAVEYRIPTLISTPDDVDVPQHADWVSVEPLLTAEEGRAAISRASLVCVPMLDTDLPAGPLVVLDALSAGTAVVATDVNGTRDYVEDGVTGVLVPPGDVHMLGQALRRLLDDEDERRRLARAGRAAARELRGDLVLAQICRAVLQAQRRRGLATGLPVDVVRPV